MKRNAFLFILAIMVQQVIAQKAWTLQQCISHAVSHNLNVKLQYDNIKQQEIALSTARNSRLPNLSGNAGENVSFGRALTSNNTYDNRNTASTNFGLSTSVPLISGGYIYHDIKAKRLNLQAALADYEKARESIVLAVITAYLEAVYQKDLVNIAEQQLELSEMQVKRVELLYQYDKASEAELAQIRASKAADELSLIQQRNSKMLALLELSQLLELSTPDSLDVVQPDTSEIRNTSLPLPETVYGEALGFKPQIKAERLRLQGAQRAIQLARSAYFPTLYFSAGIGSSYYKTTGYTTPKFGTQLKDNFNQYLALSLSVPIFNRFSTRNNVRAAKVRMHSQELQLVQAEKSLYKEIQQAYYNALAAQQQCESSKLAMHSAQTAFELMQHKYENGKATATEFQESKNNLVKAHSNASQAIYTFMFRQRILDFYRTSL